MHGWDLSFYRFGIAQDSRPRAEKTLARAPIKLRLAPTPRILAFVAREKGLRQPGSASTKLAIVLLLSNSDRDLSVV